jgi:FixJ family two-component response regulator
MIVAAITFSTFARDPGLVTLELSQTVDLRLPEMSGAEVFGQMRARDRTLPIVIISANEDVDLARTLLAQGAFDYVTKPFDLGYLERVVAAALARPPHGR